MRIINDPQVYKKLTANSHAQDLFDLDVLAVSELFAFKKGDYIIQEGTISPYLYIFLSGKLKIFTISPSGKMIIYGLFEKERPVGEMGSLWGNYPTASVQAAELSYCLGISLAKHREDLFNDNKFLRYLCQTLSHRVAALDSQLANVVAISSDVRLAAFLLQCANADDIINFDLGETSDLISTSYRHLLRMLDDFCDKGLIEKRKSNYYLLNRPALKQLALEFYDHDYIS